MDKWKQRHRGRVEPLSQTLNDLLDNNQLAQSMSISGWCSVNLSAPIFRVSVRFRDTNTNKDKDYENVNATETLEHTFFSSIYLCALWWELVLTTVKSASSRRQPLQLCVHFRFHSHSHWKSPPFMQYALGCIVGQNLPAQWQHKESN